MPDHMTEKEQIEHLEAELRRVVRLFRTEYHLSYASTIGTFAIITHKLLAESVSETDDEEENEDA